MAHPFLCVAAEIEMKKHTMREIYDSTYMACITPTTGVLATLLPERQNVPKGIDFIVRRARCCPKRGMQSADIILAENMWERVK